MRNGLKSFDRTLGKAIRVARERKGLSQFQLAAKIGIGRASLSNYERGDRQVPVRILDKLSLELEVKPGYFFPAAEAKGSESMGAAATRQLKLDQIKARLPRVSDATLDMILTVIDLSRPR